MRRHVSRRVWRLHDAACCEQSPVRRSPTEGPPSERPGRRAPPPPRGRDRHAVHRGQPDRRCCATATRSSRRCSRRSAAPSHRRPDDVRLLAGRHRGGVRRGDVRPGPGRRPGPAAHRRPRRPADREDAGRRRWTGPASRSSGSASRCSSRRSSPTTGCTARSAWSTAGSASPAASASRRSGAATRATRTSGATPTCGSRGRRSTGCSRRSSRTGPRPAGRSTTTTTSSPCSRSGARDRADRPRLGQPRAGTTCSRRST